MTTADDIGIRLTNLEREVTMLRRERRVWRSGLAAVAVAAIGGAMVAASQQNGAAEVVRTHRLEIIDAEQRPVLVAQVAESGAQVDFWSAAGNNILRLGSNDQGGDIAMWNEDGTTVFGAYATERGGEMAIWNREGARLVHTSCTSEGGSLVISTPGDEPVLRAGATSTGGNLTLHSDAGAVVFQTRAGDAGDGELRLSTRNGQLRGAMRATEAGAGLDLLMGDDHVGLRAGANGNAGGFMHLANAAGHEVFTAESADDSGGRVLIADPSGQAVATIDSAPGRGATFSLFNTDGRRQFMLGTARTGALLNMMDAAGNTVLLAGAAENSPGGLLTIRNDHGADILRAGIDASGGGGLTIASQAGDALVTAGSAPSGEGTVSVRSPDGRRHDRLEPPRQYR